MRVPEVPGSTSQPAPDAPPGSVLGAKGRRIGLNWSMLSIRCWCLPDQQLEGIAFGSLAIEEQKLQHCVLKQQRSRNFNQQRKDSIHPCCESL